MPKPLKYKPHPSIEQIEQGLLSWQKQFPRRITVERRAVTAEGRPILVALLTDAVTSDEDKQVVLLTASHAGSEICAATSLLHTIKWLISDEPLATKVRQHVITLIMPVGVPDAYARVHDDEEVGITAFGIHRGFNVTGSEPYRDWDWEGLKKTKQKGKSAQNPEGESLLSVMQEYMPDVYLDLHGVDREGLATQESIGFSWGSARSYVRGFTEEMETAANREGFCVMRPDEDAGRLSTDVVVNSAEHHFITSVRDITAPVFAYNQYHSLAFTCEVNFEESALAWIKRLLELGTERWRREFFKGYPTNLVASYGLMSIAAWGDTAKKRRRSRVDLWRKTSRLCYGTALPLPERGHTVGCCATTVRAAYKFLPDGSIGSMLKALKGKKQFNIDYLERFFENSDTLRRVPCPTEMHPCNGYIATKYRDMAEKHKVWGLSANGKQFKPPESPFKGPDDPSIGEDLPPENGMAIRLFIPYLDAAITEVRLDGHRLAKSVTDGYDVIRDGGTVVQVNIPPEKLGEFHIVTCNYETSAVRYSGFTAEDWKL